MILSMTGYGSGTASKDTLTVAIEIKTVNHRFLDIHVRVPREYHFLESELTSLSRGTLTRGRVDVSVSVCETEECDFQVDFALTGRYLDTTRRFFDQYKASMGQPDAIQPVPDMLRLLTLPGVLQNIHNNEVSTENAAVVLELARTSLTQALASVCAMRQREGDALRDDMLGNLATIEKTSTEIRELSHNAANTRQEKLRGRLKELLEPVGHHSIDPQRLAQEVALLADKCDISEELARLTSHIGQYRALCQAEEKAGKKLDFLLQEMQREANTILSKSDDLEIIHRGIAIKTDIEKLREQVQNVE